MPGLINAHCHLDYTRMAGHFPPPKVFSDWLKDITSTKADWTLGDYSESWRAGAEMLLRTGTTTVADIEAVPQLLPEVWNSTPLRVFSFLELIGITRRRPPELVMREAQEKLASLRHPRSRAALSPHAPYSTVPELLRLSARAASDHHSLLSTHVAESQLEYEMFKRGRGAMYDWLWRSGRDMADCGQGSPVQHLQHCGVLRRNLLVVHANYLGPGEGSRERRPLSAQSRVFQPSPVPRPNLNPRRCECVSWHGQPGHGSQIARADTRAEYVRRNASPGRSATLAQPATNRKHGHGEWRASFEHGWTLWTTRSRGAGRPHRLALWRAVCAFVRCCA